MKGLILTYLFTAAGALGGLRYPVFALFVYVGFAVLRPQALFGFAGDLSGLSFWVAMAMLIGWTFQRFGSWRFGRGKLIIGCLLLYVVWHAVASAFALNPQRAFPQIPILARFILPVLVGATLLDNSKLRHWMLWTIVLAQGYVGFEMNLEYVRGYNVAADGFSGMDNNCFAVSLVSSIGPAMALVISSKTWYQRALAGFAGFAILHTAMLTFSRGGMVGMLAILVVAAVMMPKRPKYIFTVLLLTVVALRFTGPELAKRYGSTFVSEGERDGSAESRVDLWKDCLKVIEQYPVLGVGPANWRVISSSYGWTEGKSAHSVWMETAAEIGIPGALLLLGFFGIAGLKLWPLARTTITDENRGDVAIAIGTVLSITGFIVSGQFVSVPGLELPYYVVMVGVALLKSQPRQVASVGVPLHTTPQEFHPALAEWQGARGRAAAR